MMLDNYLKIAKQRQQLVINYHVLPELDHRTIGQLVSVIYTPVSRTMILACLEHTQLASDKSLTAATLKLYLDRLLGSEILISIGKQSYYQKRGSDSRYLGGGIVVW